MSAAFDDWRELPDDYSLALGCVDIIQSRTDLPFDAIERFLSVLPTPERVAMDQLKIPARRNEAIVARGLARIMLAKVLRADPRHIPLEVSNFGKPRCAAGGVHFNISHTRDRVLVAMGDCEVGVDVETLRDNIQAMELAERFFFGSRAAGAGPAEG